MWRAGAAVRKRATSLLSPIRQGRPLDSKRFISSAYLADEGEPFTDAVRRLGVKFVLFSFTDLFGTLRSKMVPASQAPMLAKNGAGFAAFANYFDYGPETADVLATPDPQSLMVLPWNKQVAWVACDLSMSGSELTQGPRTALKRALRKLKDEHAMTFKTVRITAVQKCTHDSNNDCTFSFRASNSNFISFLPTRCTSLLTRATQPPSRAIPLSR
jgi:hypothetical protein